MNARMRQLASEFDERLRRDVKNVPRETRLPFNGTLSPDEQRMLDQYAFADWEVVNGY